MREIDPVLRQHYVFVQVEEPENHVEIEKNPEESTSRTDGSHLQFMGGRLLA